MREVKRILAGSLAMMAGLASVQADEGEWSGDVEAGFVTTTGNTDETTLTSEADITRDWTKWRQNLVLETRFSEQGEERTAERYAASTQVDYKFNSRDSLFIRGRYDNDDFSGFEFQASTAFGYGRRMLDSDAAQLDVSVGAGYRFSKFDERDPEEGSQREDPIARLSGDLRYSLSDNAQFRQELESEASVDGGDATSRATTSLRANLNSSLAMKLSYTVENDSNPPDGTDSTDTITAITLLYGF